MKIEPETTPEMITDEIQLNEIVSETVVINPPRFTQRRRFMEETCATAGLDNIRYSSGTSGLPHQLACTMAHRAALQSLTSWPSLILEDDLELSRASTTLPPLPADADLVYLSVTPFGCLPWTRDNLGVARHRALQGLTLASEHCSDWLNLHSMSGGQAILYVTEKGRDLWIEATLRAERLGGPFDVFTSYAMNDLNVYAPKQPVFSESGAQQRASLRANARLLQQRLTFTRHPLEPVAAGHTKVVHFKGQTITVQAVRTGSRKLEWEVLSVDRQD